MAAAFTAAKRAVNLGMRRHAHSTRAKANPDTIVMCKPEMLMR